MSRNEIGLTLMKSASPLRSHACPELRVNMFYEYEARRSQARDDKPFVCGMCRTRTKQSANELIIIIIMYNNAIAILGYSNSPSYN
jgi:hypothetical protein